MTRACTFDELCERVHNKPAIEVSIQVLAFSWKRETSDPLYAHDTWVPEKPWCGQDGITALFFQQRHGGDLMMVERKGRRFFYNRLQDGRTISVAHVIRGEACPADGRIVDATLVVEVELDARLEVLSTYVEINEREMLRRCPSLANANPT